MKMDIARRAQRTLIALIAAIAIALGLSASPWQEASAQSFLADNVKMSVSGTPGTGTITLNAAVAGAQSAATAGVPNGAKVSYFISDGGSVWEIGHGTYSSSGTTLTRGAVWSSAGGDNRDADSSALVSLTIVGEDFPPMLRNFLSGFVLSDDVTSPNIVLDIEAGEATDSTNAVLINSAAFTKSTQGAWAAGSGSNGMGNGLTVAAITWYDVCEAYNGGAADVWFDVGTTTPANICSHKPSGISGTLFRRLGAFKTDTSSHIIAFTQFGDRFIWGTTIHDEDNVAAPTSATLETVSTPPGVSTYAIFRLAYSNSTTVGSGFNVASPVQGANSGISQLISQVTGVPTGGFANVQTNTSSQVSVVSGAANGTMYVFTVGWEDARGKTN